MVLDNEKYIKECFKLAKLGGLNTLPNPKVGCVIVKNNKIISKGYHQKYGENHAERNAILNCKNQKDLIGSTLYFYEKETVTDEAGKSINYSKLNWLVVNK